MFYKRKWFLAAMLTGGALALAGCDDSGISQKTYDIASKNAAEQKDRGDDLEVKLGTATNKIDRLNTEVGRLKLAFTDAKYKADQLSFDLGAAKAKFADAKYKADQLSFDLGAAKAKFADAKYKADQLSFDLGAAKAKFADAKYKADQLSFDLGAAKAKFADAKYKADQLSFDLGAAKAKFADAKYKADQLSFDLGATKAKFADAKYKADQLSFDLGATKYELKAERDKVVQLKKDLAAVRFGSITADPGEVLAAIGPSGSGATVPITLKKVGEKGQLKLWVFGKDLDETNLRLPRIAGFIGTEFEGKRTYEGVRTTNIRAVTWSDFKTLGVMALSSDENTWDWSKTGKGSYVINSGEQVKGTYDDVPGVYTCELRQGFCSGGSDKTGNRYIKFTPKYDYLSFGAWMSKQHTEGDQPSSSVVGVFAKGGPESDVSTTTTPAEYTGGATGFYAKREVGTDASAGSYTADVSLKADFENGDVNGEVTNFQDMRTSMRLGWVVKLEGINNIKSSEMGGPFKGATSGPVDFGDVKNVDLNGNWEGKFYGEDDPPSSVAGTFNARTGDPKDVTRHYLGIVGAFGAKKVMPPPAP